MDELKLTPEELNHFISKFGWILDDSAKMVDLISQFKEIADAATQKAVAKLRENIKTWYANDVKENGFSTNEDRIVLSILSLLER